MDRERLGRNLIFLDEVDSTNSYATQLLKNVKPEEGTIVYCARQTDGRGQRGNGWNSQPNCNLTMSMILYPGYLNLKNQHYLYQIAALACYDTIAEYLNPGQFDIRIKWPNDILINRKKVCGILIENHIMENQIQSSVCGIGMNLNQIDFSGLERASSLRRFTGKDQDVKTTLYRLCELYESYYHMLRNSDLDTIRRKYETLLFGLSDWNRFQSGDLIQEFKVVGLDDSGFIQLEDRKGSLFSAGIKELTWLY
ncbi:MAG TPA: biotin--[acetyl-CoA-carboxylase] ligase [Bacteroidia bacterium]|nr:biotin--[acetyl-CoA-carboxylase] ligase [Bacteroidia bacterium]